MKIFFDTEFTGLHKDTTLISIGLIAENGEEFYGGMSDYDRSQVDEWIEENVIKHMYLGENKSYHYGTKKEISEKLNKWLKQFETVEWVSDVCHYDFVLLIDLICGHALKMPYGILNAACHDINQDIANYYNISEIDAFDKSREEIIESFGVMIDGTKHNALYDAKVIKAIYKNIEN